VVDVEPKGADADLAAYMPTTIEVVFRTGSETYTVRTDPNLMWALQTAGVVPPSALPSNPFEGCEVGASPAGQSAALSANPFDGAASATATDGNNPFDDLGVLLFAGVGEVGPDGGSDGGEGEGKLAAFPSARKNADGPAAPKAFRLPWAVATGQESPFRNGPTDRETLGILKRLVPRQQSYVDELTTKTAGKAASEEDVKELATATSKLLATKRQLDALTLLEEGTDPQAKAYNELVSETGKLRKMLRETYNITVKLPALPTEELAKHGTDRGRVLVLMREYKKALNLEKQRQIEKAARKKKSQEAGDKAGRARKQFDELQAELDRLEKRAGANPPPSAS